jgi:hypothetical protein
MNKFRLISIFVVLAMLFGFANVSSVAATSPNPLDDGGWELVAHMSNSGGMFDGNGELMPNYSYGTFVANPVASTPDFQRAFPVVADKILFITGDLSIWGIADYEDLRTLIDARGAVYPFPPNLAFEIGVGGVVSNTTGNVLSRPSVLEDPWITMDGGHYDGINNQRIVWGENNYGAGTHQALKNNHGGINVYVKAAGNVPPTALHQWTFNDGTANDSIGTAHGTLFGGATIVDGKLIVGDAQYMKTSVLPETITVKTLVAWVSPSTLAQGGGSALTIERTDNTFDAIVYAERTANQWMAGSNYFLRTPANNSGAAETSTASVMIAIVYNSNNSITIYRNGALYASYTQGSLQTYQAGATDVLIGLRHTSCGSRCWLHASIDEARIYGSALSASEIEAIFNFDTSAPTASPTQSPAANALGWNNTDVTVTWTWSDETGGSGINNAACTTSSTSTGEGELTVTATCKDLAGNEGSASHTVMVDQTLPVADAGSDQSIHAGYTVNLDGGASSDDNTTPEELSYNWSFFSTPAGNTATLNNANTATPSFTPNVSGEYVVQLIVTDDADNDSEPVFVTLSSLNMAPTADATATPMLPLLGQLVTLDGSGSSDPDGDAISYQWAVTSKPVGSAASLTNATSAIASITPDVSGTYEMTLTVSDFLESGVPLTVSFVASTAEEFAQVEIINVSTVVVALEPAEITTAGNQNAFGNFLTNTMEQIQKGKVDKAIADLEKAIARTDGCALRGAPDGNGAGMDWVTTCDAQASIYDSLVAALEALQN